MASKSSRAGAAAHTAGIFADMTLDGPEIGTLVIVVDRAKNLPNRKTIGKQDPYCAMRLGKEAKKTETDRRGGQTPRWDQELRFIVHESPDYYKLKVSCFNDDKRADLIGEAFISLTDLIKPGGGSNDLWHQLSYKGKYAGDIRMEMTYYDIRPREEKPIEKRRNRVKADADAVDALGSGSSLSGPRQLGPREARRRPLPANPGQTTPPTEVQRQEPTLPVVPPYLQEYHEEYPQDQYEAQQVYEVPAASYTQSNYQDYESDPRPLQPITPEQFRRSLSSSMQTYPQQPILDDKTQRRRSHVVEEPERMDAHEPMYSYQGDVPAEFQEINNSYNVPADDFSRHVYPEQQSAAVTESAMGYTEDELPPPPPPKHQQPPRRPQPEYPPSSFMPKTIRPTPIRPTVEQRSPLQNIEHIYGSQDVTDQQQYDSTRSIPTEALQRPSSNSEQSSRRRISNDTYAPQYADETIAMNTQHEYQQYCAPTSRTSYHSSDSDQYPNSATVENTPPVMQVRRNSFVPHQQESAEPQMPRLPDRPRSYEDQIPQLASASSTNDPYTSGTHAQSMPTLPQIGPEPRQGRALPRKQHSAQVPVRKAVSPNPYREDANGRYPDEAGGRRLSGVPFSPDAYDVLNPASSPVTNENTPFETPEQARLSGRLRESRMADDMGPIIDNDGRVIDPSDHLPTSSWAPEPERKQRKPEHVIHFRTRSDARGLATPGSSPSSVRMDVHKNTPTTPHTHSPRSAPTSSGRSSQQMYSPRPLPNQPFQSAQTRSSFGSSQNIGRSQQRNSYHEGSSSTHRPALSEYQIPVESNYVPRSSAYPPFHTTPSKVPTGTTRCAPNFDDPLAAELSMIDIGPSRGIRSGLRMSRGY